MPPGWRLDVNQDTGGSRVKRWVALDCDRFRNPDGPGNQAEPRLRLHGMSRALGEEVIWDDEKVDVNRLRTYHTLPVGFSIPAVETVLINQTDTKSTRRRNVDHGSGPAIANAIFDALAPAFARVPFTPARVKRRSTPHVAARADVD